MQGTTSSRGFAPGIRLCLALVAGIFALCAVPLSSNASEKGFACDTQRVLRHAHRLPAVAEALTRRRSLNVLAIGSSSTEGIGASGPHASYPSRLEATLSARWPRAEVTVVNAGVGGETAPRTLERLEAALKERHFDLVVWQLGTNDALRGGTPEAMKSFLEQGLHAIRANGSDVVLVDPQFFPGIKDLAAYEAVVEAIGHVAREDQVPVFSRYAMMKGWAARGEEDLLAGLAGDRFHMSDTGYDCLGKGLALHITDMARQGPAIAATR
jgi:lysophospholipase L1-like esterase